MLQAERVADFVDKGEVIVSPRRNRGRMLLVPVLVAEPDITAFGELLQFRKVGVPVFLEFHRFVVTAEELLKLAESQGFDLMTKPELPDDQLSEVEKLQKVQRENAKLLARLEALEQKQQKRPETSEPEGTAPESNHGA